MCCSKGFIKRFVPFFLTFAVGLFIASFFVSIAAPNFRFPTRSSKRQHREDDRRRDIELQRLQDENLRLRNQLSTDDSLDTNYQELKFNMPVPPAPPMPPAAPSYRLNSVPRN